MHIVLLLFACKHHRSGGLRPNAASWHLHPARDGWGPMTSQAFYSHTNLFRSIHFISNITGSGTTTKKKGAQIAEDTTDCFTQFYILAACSNYQISLNTVPELDLFMLLYLD